ncbi:MAG: hypothetical protein Q8S84_00335 [bacterium]|nr:hypothetical protein [bacterium]
MEYFPINAPNNIQNSPHPSSLPKGEGIDQLSVSSSLPLGETE